MANHDYFNPGSPYGDLSNFGPRVDTNLNTSTNPYTVPQLSVPNFDFSTPAGGTNNTFGNGNVTTQPSIFNQGVPETDNGGGSGYNNLISGLELLQGFGSLYLGNEQLKLGQDQFDFTKGSFNKNLLNQGTAYNTRLADQYRTRAAGTGTYEGAPNRLEADLNAYVATNKVNTTPV